MVNGCASLSATVLTNGAGTIPASISFRSMKLKLTATSLLALTTVLASPVWADVTAADVWANQQALYGASGISLSGDLSDGMLNSPEINIILPMGAGSFQITGEAVSMIENGDGSVTITYPSPMAINMAGGIPGEGSFSAAATLTHDGYTVIATGEPGDIAYVSGGQNLRFEIASIDIEGGEPVDFSMEGSVTLSEWTGNTRVTEGDLITYSASSNTGLVTADFDATADNVTSQSMQTTQPTQTTITASLPAGGSSIMNLSQAIRDRLNITMGTNGGGSNSETITILNGETLNSQVTRSGPQTFTASLGEDGFVLNAEASDFEMTMNDPLIMPFDIVFGIGGVSMGLDLPVNSSDAPQDFRVATGITGLTLGDDIWNIFDRGQMLPRDPADITFDITGVGTSGIDLLDFAAMAQMFGPPPVQVDDVTIEDLRISAVGAELRAMGDMTFDWTDFTTFPGAPRPEGAVTINLDGANRLMDTLVAMGLIPEDQLMMPRMMMGMFATPVGDDMLESVIEVNDQGHLLANGQRLQ